MPEAAASCSTALLPRLGRYCWPNRPARSMGGQATEASILPAVSEQCCDFPPEPTCKGAAPALRLLRLHSPAYPPILYHPAQHNDAAPRSPSSASAQTPPTRPPPTHHNRYPPTRKGAAAALLLLRLHHPRPKHAPQLLVGPQVAHIHTQQRPLRARPLLLRCRRAGGGRRLQRECSNPELLLGAGSSECKGCQRCSGIPSPKARPHWVSALKLISLHTEPPAPSSCRPAPINPPCPTRMFSSARMASMSSSGLGSAAAAAATPSSSPPPPAPPPPFFFFFFRFDLAPPPPPPGLPPAAAAAAGGGCSSACSSSSTPPAPAPCKPH